MGNLVTKWIFNFVKTMQVIIYGCSISYCVYMTLPYIFVKWAYFADLGCSEVFSRLRLLFLKIRIFCEWFWPINDEFIQLIMKQVWVTQNFDEMTIGIERKNDLIGVGFKIKIKKTFQIVKNCKNKFTYIKNAVVLRGH